MTARETNLVNAFETTLAAQLASGGTTMNLTDDPGIDSPVYLVIDPDNDSNREVILWSSGTNHAAATITRDVDSKHGTDPTHAAGTQVRLAVVKQHIEEAHDAIQQGFILEDGDGTEVTIAPIVSSGVYTQREIKFIDTGGLDINWTDTDVGSDTDPYDLTFTLDLNGLTAAAVDIAADSVAIIDANDSNLTRKESLADVIAAIDGTGLTASSGVLSVDASQAITALTGGDLTIYDDANNADVSLALGTSATESLTIQVLNGASNKTAEEIHFSTATASGTADHGKMVFDIDGTDILTIDDGGIDIASGKTIAINGTDLVVHTAGNLIDFDSAAIDVDLSEAAEEAIVNGDYIIFLDGGATGAAKKENIADVATLFAGTGLTASSSVISVDASQAITALTGGDLTIFDDANNADVSLKMGTSATEALSIEVLNGGSNKTAEEIKIQTSTASGTANHGKISVYIDDVEILDIGINKSGDIKFIDENKNPDKKYKSVNKIEHSPINKELNIKSEISSIIMQELELKDISDLDNGALGYTIGWDSLNHIKIILAVENYFSIKFSSENFETLTSLDDIVNSVETNLILETVLSCPST